MLNSLVTGPEDGPKLLIAHGLYGSARNWGVLARPLSDRFRVTSVDMRNHGDSPWFDSHGYEEMAEDLAGVLDGPSHVLGHSMGGKAAMALALCHPDKVDRLIVADMAPVAYDHDQTRFIEAMRGVDLARVSRRSEAAAQLEGIDAGVASFLLQSLDIAGQKWKLNLDVLEAEMPRILGWPAFEGRFNGPALFLSGSESDYVRREHRDAIKALFPKARFASIKGAGHWLHADKPAETQAAIRAFLSAPGP